MSGMANSPGPSRAHRGAPRAELPTALPIGLHLAGFAGAILLMTWGVFALFFLALGGFSLDGLMHQLANLANRYVAADAARREAFRQVLAAAHLVVAAVLVALRRRHLLPAGLTQGHPRHG
jgi:hypothetical protein